MFDEISISDNFFPHISDAKLINQKLWELSWGYLLTGARGWYFGYWKKFAVTIGTVNFGNLGFLDLLWSYEIYFCRVLDI